MGLFDSWFKRGAKTEVEQPRLGQMELVPANARTIRYDAGLVQSLKDDHVELVKMYGQLGREVEAGRYSVISSSLLAFKTRLEGHLLTENVRFYVYLEQSMANDADNMAIIRDFRREMNGIARGVVDFVRRYQQQAVNSTNHEEFMQEYAAVGKLLTMRIEREEGSLYPLYHP